MAFHQIPARQIAFSLVEEESGVNCGKLQDIFIKVTQTQNCVDLFEDFAAAGDKERNILGPKHYLQIKCSFLARFGKT